MKIEMMTIYDYAKLGEEAKELLLKTNALLFDHYMEDQDTIYVYFLDSFFVEVTVRNEKVIFNLPYKRGYCISKSQLHEIEKKRMFSGSELLIGNGIQKRY